MEIESNGATGRPESTSRRDALKRGAVIGGLVWVAPAVQLIGINPAHAQTASPPAGGSGGGGGAGGGGGVGGGGAGGGGGSGGGGGVGGGGSGGGSGGGGSP
ncbi:MAG: twin-arginine translocation signal domain-containing protein [Actinobacteria bacterium]|nr:twin-arginine translocation signal domain-containing protein [Actinomycetota bacterium]